MWQWMYPFLLVVMMVLHSITACAQNDSIPKMSIDSMLLKQKGMIGQLAKNLFRDTSTSRNGIQRTEEPFKKFEGKTVRHIILQPLVFGVSVKDTSRRLQNLTNLSNDLHYQTRNFVIRNNLFFKEKERVSPYLLGDNERHLRDLPFIRDAQIVLIPVAGTKDSVDVSVITKDVLSIGGSFKLKNTKRAEITIKEDNFFGWGDRLQLQALYDLKRTRQLGHGFAYIKRNIGGSFIDASAGYLDFNNTFSSRQKEEHIAYLRLVRPLINRYMQWTYGAELESHRTQNFYNTDSIYNNDFRYKYRRADLWGAWNIDADRVRGNNEKERIRRLVGLRFIQKDFSEIPVKFKSEYSYWYTDIKAFLGSFAIFKQNFYKTNYIYGFGINEDVPEGGEVSFTSGYTQINDRARPYAALSFQRYYFTPSEHYFNYAFRVGSYFYKKQFEDVDVLASLDYFSCLNQLTPKWKQRMFINLSATKQVNNLLNEPLLLDSEYGLREFRNGKEGGTQRLTLRAESVFFSPWSVLLFKFAPFAFANTSYINLKTENIYDPKTYTSIGGGIRTRNETLIFGTIEFKAIYYPHKNFYNETWRREFNTNIRFRYNREFIKRPEFIRTNW
jgi:hypothetical protein